MKTFTSAFSLFAVTLVTLASLVVPLQSAQAQSNRYGVVCLFNKTNSTIRYQYRWGERNWKSYTLEVGESAYHSWTYERGSKSSPDFTIKFDADATSRAYFRTYSLERYQAMDKSCDDAKIYNFRPVGNSRYIDLYSAN